MAVGGIDERQRALMKAQMAANEKIQEIGKAVKQAEKEGQEKVDYIRSNYQVQEEKVKSQHEQNVANEQQRGYEKIRDLRRKHGKKVAEMTRKNEQELQTLQDGHKKKMEELTHQQNLKTKEIATKNANEVVSKQKAHQFRMNLVKSSNDSLVQNVDQQGKQKIQKTAEISRNELEKMKKLYSDASEQSRKHFEKNFKNQLKNQTEALNRINQNANQNLNQLRSDYTRNLASYSDRTVDPFYQMVDLQASLTDQEDAYILSAAIPPHEKESITISVKGDEVMIAGHRRNREEQVNPETGVVSQTASFQSFHQRFPIDWPVDERSISKEFEGNQLVVRIPKKGPYAKPKPFESEPERLLARKPVFPDNIAPDPKENPKLSRGSRPIVDKD